MATCSSSLENGYDLTNHIEDIVYYGSEAKPKEIFTEGSAAYQAFFRAAKKTAPEAYDLRNILIESWQSFTPEHSWTMPDDFNVKIKTMVKKDVVIKVPELNSSFTHIFTVNEGTEKGLALAANVVHSIDAFIVREINRRCNYDMHAVEDMIRTIGRMGVNHTNQNNKLSHVPTVRFNQMKYFVANSHEVGYLDKLYRILTKMASYKPFEVVCVHDEFKCHANNMNIVRYWYKEILADIADSTLMQQIIRDIHNTTTLKLERASNDLGDLIRKSNYGIA